MLRILIVLTTVLHAAVFAVAQEKPTAATLSPDQELVVQWTSRQFRSYLDGRTFEGWSERDKTQLETRLIDTLKGPHNREYFEAIGSLGALRSHKGLSALRQIAYDRAEKSNRDRWMAIRAIGLIGEKADVPQLIPLVYHGNTNTRWWAQISLVRITGQNFDSDWNAWGNWWNESGGEPKYVATIVRWWDGQPSDRELADSLAKSDHEFLGKLKGEQRK
jgi:hypothetical protein